MFRMRALISEFGGKWRPNGKTAYPRYSPIRRLWAKQKLTSVLICGVVFALAYKIMSKRLWGKVSRKGLSVVLCGNLG